jgi:hypothetical protein
LTVVSCRSLREELIVATEEAAKLLLEGEKEQFRSEIVETLRNTNPPKSNLTREQRKSIKDLSKKKNILILPADKGRATVILNTDYYKQKVNMMLNDEHTYEKLKKNRTSSYKRKLKSILTPLKRNGKIKDFI